jgi:hypothetical protein
MYVKVDYTHTTISCMCMRVVYVGVRYVCMSAGGVVLLVTACYWPPLALVITNLWHNVCFSNSKLLALITAVVLSRVNLEQAKYNFSWIS